MPLYTTIEALGSGPRILPSEGTLLNKLLWTCTHISEALRRLRLASTALRIRELDPTLLLTQQLCYLFLCAANWKLNMQAAMDTILLAGRTIHLLVQMHSILEGGQITQKIWVPALSGGNIVKEMPRITGQWTVTEASLEKVQSIRQELCMVVDVMELMQYIDDYRYESCKSYPRFGNLLRLGAESPSQYL